MQKRRGMYLGWCSERTQDCRGEKDRNERSQEVYLLREEEQSILKDA